MLCSKSRLSIAIAVTLVALLNLASPAFAGLDEGEAALKRRDYATALQELGPLAEHGNIEAQTKIGLLYLLGKGVPQDCQKAFDLFHSAADRGSADAMDYLAGIYFSGCGPIARAYENGLEWAKRAADAGSAGGLASIGQAYENGWGVQQDLVEAVKWYRKAAEQGHPKGQRYLGDMYMLGRGVFKNAAEAMRWYRKAAEHEDPLAQYSLAHDGYFSGEGLPKDVKEAFNWGLRSAKNGHPIAQSFVGTLYANGIGVPKDLEEAAKWFRRAAEQGDAMGQSTLGAFYFDGTGNLPKDRVESYVWISLAAEQGYPRGIQLQKFVRKNLSQTEIEEAERRLIERRKSIGGVWRFQKP